MADTKIYEVRLIQDDPVLGVQYGTVEVTGTPIERLTDMQKMYRKQGFLRMRSQYNSQRIITK